MMDDDYPQVTYKHTKIARSLHDPPNDKKQREIEQQIAKQISDGFDEYFRLSFLGYRFIQDNELLNSGLIDESGDNDDNS
jgi:hypothetical protein